MKYLVFISLNLLLINCSSIFETNSSEKSYHFRLINEKGTQIGEETYENIRDFSNGLIAVKQNGLWGYVDKNGVLKIPFQFVDVSNFSIEPPWAAVEFSFEDEQVKKRWGYIDTTGKVVVKPQFYHASEFINGISQVATDKIKYKLHHRYEKYFFTKEQKLIYHDGEYGVYSDVITHNLSEGLLPSCEKGFWGYRNIKNEWIIPPTYDEVGSFQNGLARAKKGSLKKERDCIFNDPEDNSGYWGYIDNSGKEKIPFKFKRAGDFIMGVALVNELYKSSLTPADTYSFYYIDINGKNKYNLFFSTAKDFNIEGYTSVGLDKNRELDGKRKTKRLFGNGNIIDIQGNLIQLSLEEGEDVFGVYPAQTSGILKITFVKLSDPKNEYSDKIYYSKYYKKDLSLYLDKRFPPSFRKFAGPPDEMTGNFQTGITWEAIEINKK